MPDPVATNSNTQPRSFLCMAVDFVAETFLHPMAAVRNVANCLPVKGLVVLASIIAVEALHQACMDSQVRADIVFRNDFDTAMTNDGAPSIFSVAFQLSGAATLGIDSQDRYVNSLSFSAGVSEVAQTS